MVDLPTPTLPRPDASVRGARSADAAALADLTLASWTRQYATVLPAEAAALDADALTVRWAEALASPGGGTVLVACRGEQVVGLALVGPSSDPDLDPDRDAELVELVVHPDATREGHGSRLLAAAVDAARAGGSTALVVWCGVADDARRAFLESAGLQPDGASRTLDDGAGVQWRQVRLGASLAEA